VPIVETETNREGLLTHAVDWVFGYDFFLSYSHGDGTRLPQFLKERLAQIGFRVFLDQTEFVAGMDLPRETRRHIAKSRKLVVIGRPGALQSEWVKREVDVALAQGKIPVVIDVNRAVEAARDTALASTALTEHWLRLNALMADPDGEPPEAIIGELVRGFEHTRQEIKRQRIFAAAAVVLAVMAGVAIWQAIDATRAKMVAEVQRDRAQRVLDQVIAANNRRVQTETRRLHDNGVLYVAPGSAGDAATADSEGGVLLDKANALITQASKLIESENLKGARGPLELALNLLTLVTTLHGGSHC
jgi:hypothetical protein